MNEKFCRICQTTKPVTAFWKSHTVKSGLMSSCKVCATEYHRAYAKTNREALNAKLAAKLRKQREQAATRPRPARCEGCGLPSSRTLQWDHDHATGKFRGWLCHLCNKALGHVRESPATLRRLADYLETRQ